MLRLNTAPIRPLHDFEFDLANRWAINEGWNPGLHDASIFNPADPGSLMTMEIAGRPVGVISAVRQTPDFAFIGFFVLPPEYRRARYGWTLMRSAIDRIEDRVVGAEVIFELVRTYSHYGMKAYYNTVSFHGTAPLQPKPWIKGIERVADASSDECAAYDTANFGVDRSLFLNPWLALPDSLSLVFREGGRVRGLGTARRCHHGVRIGPLQADTPEIAEALFDALSSLAPGEELSIDCPDINPDAACLARAKGFVSGSETARLYRGEPPERRPDRIFGLMSFSLG